VEPARTLAIAGAGIGGLTAALTLNRIGYRVIILERETELTEAGAGLQLSPNASRVLIDLGLEQSLASTAITPEAIRVINARSGRDIARLPLGERVSARFRAPYWLIHRAALQAALAAKVRATPGIELRLGWRFDEVTDEASGVTVIQRRGMSYRAERVQALIGADGVWSAVRQQVFPEAGPRFSRRIAWRGMIDAAHAPRFFEKRNVHLWMGPNAHLVAYPVVGSGSINLVAIVTGEWNKPGWSEPGYAAELARHFTKPWDDFARALINATPSWRKWALFEVPNPVFAKGAVAMLGDAAHAMLPFAAQGAAMAIEDAAVLARSIETHPDDLTAAFRHYETARRARVSRVQRLSRQNGQIYHLKGVASTARDQTMRLLGGKRLLARQNWIYGWRP